MGVVMEGAWGLLGVGVYLGNSSRHEMGSIFAEHGMPAMEIKSGVKSSGSYLPT